MLVAMLAATPAFAQSPGIDFSGEWTNFALDVEGDPRVQEMGNILNIPYNEAGRQGAEVMNLSRALIAQDANALLDTATKTMGAENLRTIQYSASGFSFVFAQAATPGGPWPRFSVKSYTREIDYDAPASRVQLIRSSVDKRGGGGVGIPVVDQTQNQVILPNAAWTQQVDIWLTPYGFIKAAATRRPALKQERIRGRNYNVITFTENKYTVRGYLNDQNMVERVQTWIEHPAAGDLLIETTYTDYKDFDGVRYPTKIVQAQGGHPVLDLTVTDVKPNVPVNIQPGQRGGGGGGGAQPVTVRTVKVDDGIFYLIGGTNNSVGVEFKDYIVMIEAPQNGERAAAFYAELKRQIPNKPLKYVINTHHHFDHSGGIRAAAAEGATIITHRLNKPYYEKALTGPRTLAPDTLVKSGRKMVFETLNDKKVLTDGTRTIEIHLVKDSPHTDGTVMAYLPKEKILVEADLFDFPGPGVPAVTEGPATAANLVDNIERLKLDVQKLLPVHAPGVVPPAELYRAAKRPVPPGSAY
jgi:glyoxylase-like metal-dependent hydrolase (beta-lactamase superfamily II)